MQIGHISSVFCQCDILLQYSGPSKDALAYVNWLREDNRFSDILVQISPSENGHTFPALKLRYKPSLVQVSYKIFSCKLSLLGLT